MTDLEESTCPGCGAKVVVAILGSSKQRIQLDPRPHREGVYYFGRGGQLQQMKEGAKIATGTPMFRAHEAICPQMALFREAPRK